MSFSIFHFGQSLDIAICGHLDNSRILVRFFSHLNYVLLHHIQHKRLFLYTNSWYVQISGIENIYEGWECTVVFLFSGIQY